MKLFTWLRMADVGTVGTPLWQPHCGTSYKKNIDIFSSVCPQNGGELQADGTWLQQTWKIDAPWPKELPELAISKGQGYYPVLTNDRNGVLAVLDDDGLQTLAADNLIALLNSRFDRSFMTGVMIDLEKIPSNRKDALSCFYEKLYSRLHAEGLEVIASVRPYAQTDVDYDDAYCYDFNAIRQNCDLMELRCYNYWKPLPRSVGPEWWTRKCIDVVCASGISPSRLLLGIGAMCNWHEHGIPGNFVQIPTTNARLLVEGQRQWIESGINGAVGEEYAVSGDGYLWMSSGDTVSRRLQIVREYGLLGAILFIPSHCADDHFSALRNR